MQNKTNDMMSETKAVWLQAVKDAHADRARLFARGYTREEMLSANHRIQDATDNFNACE